MGFDWRRLEQADRGRLDALVIPLAIVFLVGGLAGLLTHLALGRPSTPAGSALSLVLGAAMVVQGLRLRRRRRQSRPERPSGPS